LFTLQIGEVRLLVEAGALETEGVHHVVDFDISVLDTLLSLLGGSVSTRVWKERQFGLAPCSAGCGLPPHVGLAAGAGSGARTDVDGALDDHSAIDLVDDAINLLQIVRVRDDLVSGEGIL